MGKCLVCSHSKVTCQLELGAHPVSNHFAATASKSNKLYDIDLGICPQCGTIQLFQPLPYEALVSPYDWFTYREPEGHLDDLVAKVMSLLGIHHSSRILGISTKDESTIERFSKLGFTKTSVLNASVDLGIVTRNAGVESVQHHLNNECAYNWVTETGRSDVVIARHILEHAEDVHGFISALTTLLVDDGYIVIEVPDCLANLERQDITMVWEEHTVYFTPDSFRNLFAEIGLDVILYENYPQSFENCLVVIGRKRPVKTQKIDQTLVSSSSALDVFHEYVNSFTNWREKYRSYLEQYINQGGKVALYGAGHLSCAFVNYYGLADLVSFVIDDTPEKQGLFLSGSNLSIVSSEFLITEEITLCLMGLSPDIEDKVIAKNASFFRAGGEFLSIFVASKRSIRSAMQSV